MLRRLMAVAAVAAGLGLATGAARAQDAKTEKQARDPRAVGSLVWGIKGGLTMATLSGDGSNPSASGADPTLHQGVAIGGFSTWRFTDQLALQSEFYLASKGANFEDLGGENIDENYLYVEVPLMARFDLALDDVFHVYGVAGPSFGYLLDAKARDKDELNLFDVAANAGIGADMKVGSNLISLDVRYSFGLLDTVDHEDSTGKNRVLSFLLGFTT